MTHKKIPQKKSLFLFGLAMFFIGLNPNKLKTPEEFQFPEFNYEVKVENIEEKLRDYEKEINRCFKKIDYSFIESLESSGNPLAYNKKSRATGLMQITPITLTDWNNINPLKNYTLDDMKDPEKNREVGRWYLEKRIPQLLDNFGIPNSLENVLASYNWGPSRVRKLGGITKENFNELPRETRNYISRYMKMLEAS